MSEPEEKAGPGVAIAVAGCLYLLMVAGALLWLWLRDDLGALARFAVGERGQWVGLLAGVTVGGALTVGIAGLSRYLPFFRALEVRVAGMLGDLTDRQMLWLSLWSAVGEELFFRLAVQQALGIWWSVAMFTVLNTGPGLWAWSLVAVVMGTVFSLMVQWGFGLLAVTVAHALVTYLSLRRITPA